MSNNNNNNTSVAKKDIKFTIGADPEFICADKHGEILSADKYIDRNIRHSSEFGVDGNCVTFELRPKPSKNPLVVVNNIHNIFLNQVNENPEFLKFKWISGSYYKGYPLGGHVHFGLNDKQLNHTRATEILDNYLGNVCLLLENKKDGVARRADGYYGRRGNYRTQEWGFEYRPLSSWLTSPHIASAILCLGYTIIHEAVNNTEFKWHTYSTSSDFIYLRHDKIFPKFSKIWAEITQMKMYQVYKPYIDLIYFLVTNKKNWLPATDMKECWGILDIKPVANKVNFGTIWSRYNTEQ